MNKVAIAVMVVGALITVGGIALIFTGDSFEENIEEGIIYEGADGAIGIDQVNPNNASKYVVHLVDVKYVGGTGGGYNEAHGNSTWNLTEADCDKVKSFSLKMDDTEMFYPQCNYIKDEIDDAAIKDIESHLGGDDNPNKNLFLWAYDFNAGKKGTSIPAEKINKMIEEELLIVEKLPDTARLAAEVDVNLGYITYGGFIRIDIEYMAGILNKAEDDKFYRWEDVEQYHAIYTLVLDYINKTYGLK